MGVDAGSLEEALTCRTIAIVGDAVAKPLTSVEAHDTRDALAKGKIIAYISEKNENMVLPYLAVELGTSSTIFRKMDLLF